MSEISSMQHVALLFAGFWAERFGVSGLDFGLRITVP